jgi:hypothetical protein
MGKRAGSSMTTSGSKPNDPNVKAAMIRNDIEQTRADMSRTVNQIEERLSPAHLKDQVLEQLHEAKETVKEDLARDFAQVKGKVHDEIQDAKLAVREATLGKVEHMAHDARETITEAGTSVLDTIKANPIPTALIAVGLGWLVMGRNRTTTSRTRRIAGRGDAFGGYHMGYEGDYGDYDYEEYDFGRERGRDYGRSASNLAHRVQEGASHLVDETRGVARDVGETVGRVAHDASETASRVAHEARDMVGQVADEAQMTASRAVRGARRRVVRAEREVENQMQENPLAVGAVALAIGAAIGLALPHTRKEDEWMGETKDRLLHRAEDVAQQAISKAEEAAGNLTEKISQGKDGGSSESKGSSQSRSQIS